IPYSFTKIMKRLGVGKKKFYNSIIRPLWNYGLIDIEQYEKSISYGQKPMNIIVYEYPQNDVTKKYKSLEKIRDYDTEYTSTARTNAKKGGRKQKKRMEGVIEKQKERKRIYKEKTKKKKRRRILKKEGGVSQRNTIMIQIVLIIIQIVLIMIQIIIYLSMKEK